MRLGQTLRLGVAIIAATVGVVAATGSAGAGPIQGGKIAYMSTFSGQADIYSMEADGTGQFNLTQDKTTNVRVDVEPAWSPAGTLVAFERQYVSRNKDAMGGSDIFLVKSDGTKLGNVTGSSTPKIRNSHPSWSPNGNLIVFSSNRDGNFELYTIKASGLGLSQLTKTRAPVQNLEPQWSPDGNSVVFTRTSMSPTLSGSGIYLLKVSTGTVGRLSPPSHGSADHNAMWSPNGTRIAFASDRAGSNDIYVMSASGTGLMQLTLKISNDDHPTWSPDGTQIAFVSDRTGATEIFALNVTSPVPNPAPEVMKQLTFDKAFKSNPTWQRTSPVPGQRLAR